MQAQTLTYASPPIGKIYQFRKINVSFEPIMQFGCPFQFMTKRTISNCMGVEPCEDIFSKNELVAQ